MIDVSVYSLGMWIQLVFLLSVLVCASYLDYKYKIVPRSLFTVWFTGVTIIHYVTVKTSYIYPQHYASVVSVSVLIGVVIAAVSLLINAQIGDILTLVGVSYTVPILRQPFGKITSYYMLDISIILLFTYALVVIYSKLVIASEYKNISELMNQPNRGFVIVGIRTNSTIITLREYIQYVSSQNISSTTDITSESIRAYYEASIYPLPSNIETVVSNFRDIYSSEKVSLVSVVPLIVYITLSVILFLLISFLYL